MVKKSLSKEVLINLRFKWWQAQTCNVLAGPDMQCSKQRLGSGDEHDIFYKEKASVAGE